VFTHPALFWVAITAIVAIGVTAVVVAKARAWV
jgi:hypothetical protein